MLSSLNKEIIIIIIIIIIILEDDGSDLQIPQHFCEMMALMAIRIHVLFGGSSLELDKTDTLESSSLALCHFRPKGKKYGQTRN